MRRRPAPPTRPRAQRGVALVVTLILLAVISLLSLTAMRSTTLDTRIAINHQHRQYAFQAAENGLTKLTVDDPGNVRVPGTLAAAPVLNENYYQGKDVTGTLDQSADLTMDLIEIAPAGHYKFSGFGLNVTTYIYQADSIGRVDGTGTQAHHRMEVALIRD